VARKWAPPTPIPQSQSQAPLLPLPSWVFRVFRLTHSMSFPTCRLIAVAWREAQVVRGRISSAGWRRHRRASRLTSHTTPTCMRMYEPHVSLTCDVSLMGFYMCAPRAAGREAVGLNYGTMPPTEHEGRPPRWHGGLEREVLLRASIKTSGVRNESPPRKDSDK
jgi:hypothetical protein